MKRSQQRKAEVVATPSSKANGLHGSPAAAPAPAAKEPHTPLGAQHRVLLHATPNTPVVSPQAVVAATAVATARGRGWQAHTPGRSMRRTLDPSIAAAADSAAAAGGAAAHAGPDTEAAAVLRGGGGGGLAKYGSHTGLPGIAEAAGHLLSELAPLAKWRQEVLMVRLVAGLTLALAVGYVLLFAPARLGWRAESHLVATFGADNALAFALFNLLGLFPALLGCVAWPALRSYDKHKVLRPDLRRYIAASLFAGAFALLAYLAMWTPRAGKPSTLPPKQLSGRMRFLQRAYESRLWPAALLAATCWLLSFPLVVSAATWAQFGYLATHSFTIHVMLLDLTLLTLLSPWLVIHDATARSWGPAKTPLGKTLLGLAMVVAPAVGPGVYLLLRPVSRAGGVLRKGWLRRACKAVGAGVTAPFRHPGAVGVTDEAVQAAGRPAGSTTSGSPRGARARPDSRQGQAGAGASRGGRLSVQVAEAAAVPLPALPSAARASVGAAAEAVGQWWQHGWVWLGQKLARLRGGGTPVASEHEVAGDELDINGTDGGVSDNTPGPRTHHSLPFGSFFHHQQTAAEQQQNPWPLGPTPSPIKCRDAALGGRQGPEVFLFSDDYDEYEFDFDQETTSDGEDEEEEEESSGGELADSSSEDGVSEGDDQDVGVLDSDDLLTGEDDEEEQDVGAAQLSGGSGGWVPGGSAGSRPAKDAAMKLLGELGQQEHPRLASQVRI